MAGLNGHIELELGGEKRSFKFTVYPYGEAMIDMGIRFGENMEKMDSPAFLYVLAYHTINYSRLLKSEAPVEKVDVFTWIDESGETFLTPFREFVFQTMFKNVQELAPEAGKKPKATKKKQSQSTGTGT